MGVENVKALQSHAVDINLLADSIRSLQLPTGEIPWHEGGKTDPWDHVESAMGLSIAGAVDEAVRAYYWMADFQNEDGSWYSAYRLGEPVDRTRESNMSSYIAVGTFHHYLITRDRDFLERMWDTVSRGIDFSLGMQASGGEIYWAKNQENQVDAMSLLTGSSSIFLSIRCALAIACILGKSRPAWEKAIVRLRDAIRFRPHLFNREKARYSMDWYYPVLSGAMTGLQAVKRIEKLWDTFAVEGLGIRCVSDRPWVTMAETSELTIALAGMGKRELAGHVFSWISDKKFDDGTYWCGVTFPDGVIWPEEKITWTNAVVMMAHDALMGITAGFNIFNHSFWESATMPLRQRSLFAGEGIRAESSDHAAEMRGKA